MTSRNSTIDPGQPCISISGSGFGLGRAGVDQVDALTVDLVSELVERVDAGFWTRQSNSSHQ